jgi:bifunctional UDP-N-acetylglucosamine pyrophosphorylase / glucosamine-1-phosphate N-acetyltransferase
VKAIVLAAGKGSRMKSNKIKVAHYVGGKPIVKYLIDTLDELDVKDIYLVVGHQFEVLKKELDNPRITWVMQEEQLGTGHAVMQADSFFNNRKTVLVLPGDCPLVSKETISLLIKHHEYYKASATVLTANMEEPGNYGRILRDKNEFVKAIKEAKDCKKEELEIKEINTGIYLFDSEKLFDALKRVNNQNAQKEYYLTDVVAILRKDKDQVAAFCTENSHEIIGINTRLELAKINKRIFKENNTKKMLDGVTILDPDTTFIDSTVEIGCDTIIEPFTIIKGETKIGKNCHLGAHSYIENANIKDNSIIDAFTNLMK